MIPRECKRLAEVDFPIAEVSSRAVSEKYAGKGYPSMLHLWWARRPLGACRAMLLAVLLPDPCDPCCPEEFRNSARTALARTWQKAARSNTDLRAALLKFIAGFANWEQSASPLYLETARTLVKAAYPEEPPTVVDPFAGGGSIPLEALRVGCDAYASDLNPVACLILKVMLEDIPRRGKGLADELRQVGAKIQAAAEKQLAELYPPDRDGATPIAYLWARTVRCETPNCGAEIPLVRSLWLSKKATGRRALRYRVVRPRGLPPRLEFEVFEPRKESEVQSGSVSRAKGTCPCCNITLPPERVRAQLSVERGGGDVRFDAKGHRIGGATLLAVVTRQEGTTGRQYRTASDADYQAVYLAQRRLERIRAKSTSGFDPVPDERTPPGGGSGAGRAFSIQKYGMMNFGDLFTARQKLASCALTQLIVNTRGQSSHDHCENLLACALSRVTMSGMSCTRWNASGEKMQHTFGRQALPIVWDFAEVAPLADAPGSWRSGYELVADIIDSYPPLSPGQAEIADACEHPLTDEAADIWFTDPPYYDAVPYADLSDFFFVWLKRAVPGSRLLRDPFDAKNALTPKSREIVQDETKTFDGRAKDRHFFEERMGGAFGEGRRLLRENGLGLVVFAHKTTEGWEALLSGMIKSKWTITSSWPIATELGTRLRARDSAALATSVHLICRPRTTDDTGDWGGVLRELPKRVADWMARLEKEGVRGADLVFACIGPALEIFSRYARVETPDGTQKTLAEYLEKVWEVVGRVALEQVLGTPEARARNGDAGALEEDARLTALFLWTIQSTNGESAEGDEDDEEEAAGDEEDGSSKKKPGLTLIYDVARRFAQPLGIHLDEWEGRIIETKKGVVRLLPVRERSAALFGEAGADLAARRIERLSKGSEQLDLFSAAGLAEDAPPDGAPKRGRKKDVAEEALKTRREATTLDRVHAAMLLQADGRANALRSLLKSEMERSPDFLRLANSLSALYPKDSEEKRLLDAMLLAVPR